MYYFTFFRPGVYSIFYRTHVPDFFLQLNYPCLKYRLPPFMLVREKVPIAPLVNLTTSTGKMRLILQTVLVTLLNNKKVLSELPRESGRIRLTD